LANLHAVQHAIEWFHGDVTDLELVRRATRDVQFVFHQAATASIPFSVADPMTTHHVCTTGTLHILMAAREGQVARVIYASSSCAYGDASPLPLTETSVSRPLSPLAVAKLAGEEYCGTFHHLFGLETVRLRYFSVFGPRQTWDRPHATVIPQFMRAMLNGRPPVIQGDGRQTRDFTYVSDVVQANLLAMEAPRVAGRVYNVATGRRTALLDLVDLINEVLGTQIRPIHDNPRPGDIRHSQADISQAQIDLGFCPCTDLPDNLAQCVAHYRKRIESHAGHPRRRGTAVAAKR
jgi:UDP-glucose 4-epimerase